MSHILLYTSAAIFTISQTHSVLRICTNTLAQRTAAAILNTVLLYLH